MGEIFDNYKEFKSFEVTFTNNIGKVNVLPCKIQGISGNVMTIVADKELQYQAKVGDTLHLKIVLESGVYTATSNVIEVAEDLANIEYTIEVPTNTQHSQRREYYRTDLPIDIEITISEENKNNIENVKIDTPVDIEININSQGKNTVIKGKTKNISGNGMCFVSDKTIEKNQNSEITILLKFDDRSITTNAKHVYSKEFLNSMGDTIYLHAFYFTNIHQHDIDFIVKKCFLHQLELRKQNYL